MHLTITSLPEEYYHVLHMIMVMGDEAVSRGKRHREIVSAEITVLDPTRGMPTHTGRGINPKIGLLEAAQLIAGEATPQLMVKAGRTFAQYMDGDVFHGSYGPRVRPQIPMALDRLVEDPGSRQAFINIWDPLYDLTNVRSDLPCTTSLQFLIRDDKLHMVTYMRSNDAWLGFPYDVFQFTQLQQALAWSLEIGVGTYHHHVGSLHIYEQHWAAVGSVSERDLREGDTWLTDLDCNLETPALRWQHIRDVAGRALKGIGDKVGWKLAESTAEAVRALNG